MKRSAIARGLLVALLFLTVFGSQGCGILIVHYIKLNADGTMNVAYRLFFPQSTMASMKITPGAGRSGRALTPAEKKRLAEVNRKKAKGECVLGEIFQWDAKLGKIVDELSVRDEKDSTDCITLISFRTRKQSKLPHSDPTGFVPRYDPAGRRLIFFMDKKSDLRDGFKNKNANVKPRKETSSSENPMGGLMNAMLSMIQYQIYLDGMEVERVLISGMGPDRRPRKPMLLPVIRAGSLRMLDLNYLFTLMKYGDDDVQIVVHLK